MRSAGCAFNDVADREFDRHVKRRCPPTAGLAGRRPGWVASYVEAGRLAGGGEFPDGRPDGP